MSNNIYEYLKNENDLHMISYLNDKYEEPDNLLIKNYWKSLEYYFNGDTKKIKNFIVDKEVVLNEKWTILMNYPTNLKKLLNNKVNMSSIANEIIKIICCEQNTNVRIIHPLLFILCYPYLHPHINIMKIYNKSTFNIKLINSKTKIRPQYNYTFSIFYYLFTNIDLNILIEKQRFSNNLFFTECLEQLYFNFQIEKLIDMNLELDDICKVRFSDISIGIDYEKLENSSNKYNKKINKMKTELYLSESKNEFFNSIIIEINELRHSKIADEERKLAIYRKTGKISLDFYILEDDFDDFCKKLLEKLGSHIYKTLDPQLGILFYLTCVDKININHSSYFLNIFNKSKDGILFEEIISIYKGHIKMNNFIELCNLELDDSHFIERIPDNLMESRLNSLGIDIVIMLPRRSDSKNSVAIKEVYTTFREGYFNFIVKKLGNNNEKYMNLLLNKNQEYYNIIKNLIEPSINIFYNKITKEDILKYNLVEPVPFLQNSESKYDKEGVSLVNLRHFFGNIIKLDEIDDGLLTIPKCKYISKQIMNNILLK